MKIKFYSISVQHKLSLPCFEYWPAWEGYTADFFGMNKSYEKRCASLQLHFCGYTLSIFREVKK